MIILDNSNKSIEVVLNAAVATNQLEWSASTKYITTNCGVNCIPCISDVGEDGLTNDTTAVTMSFATTQSNPTVTYTQEITYISIYNSDTVAAVVTVQIRDISSTRILVKVMLSPGSHLIYNEESGWQIFDSTGAAPGSGGGGGAFIPLAGTTMGSPVYGSIVTDLDALPSPLLVDDQSDNGFILQSTYPTGTSADASQVNLSYAYLTLSNSSTGNGVSTITVNWQYIDIQALGTLLRTQSSDVLISTSDTGFIGIQYSAADAAGYVLTNQTGTSILHRDANDARYLLQSKILTTTSVLNFPSTSPGNSSDLTITLTGAAIGDVILLGIDNASTLSNGLFTAWVSATNTVKVRFSNNSGVSTLDPASGTFRVTIIKP